MKSPHKCVSMEKWMGRELFSSISSSFYNTRLQTGLLIKRHLFLTILKAGTSKIKALADLVSGERAHYLIQRWLYFPLSSHGGGISELSEVFLLGQSLQSWGTHFHDLITSKRSTFKYYLLKSRNKRMNFEGMQHLVHHWNSAQGCSNLGWF